MTDIEKKIDVLFDELVPDSGKADTVAGEIIRAVSRIGYRNYNDGDHVGVGYGKETCNPAARYLSKKCGGEVAKALTEIWGEWDDSRYEAGLLKLESAVLEYIEQHPELKKTPNNEDMWDFFDGNEDVDDEEDEW